MNHAVEEQVRALAEPLWESAARPYGMAMDFWLMAEQMVLEMVVATARVQSVMLTEAPPPRGELPEAAPVSQIRAMAECMWESAGRQYEMTQDFWLAAERHVLAMIRATHVGSTAKPIDEISSLTPAAYLERIRTSAYYMWDSAGRQYGQALEFWLAAERQTLAMLTSVYAAPKPDEGSPEPAAAPGAADAAEPEMVAEPDVANEVAQPGPPAPVLARVAATEGLATEPAVAKRRKRTSPTKPKSAASIAGVEGSERSEANDR